MFAVMWFMSVVALLMMDTRTGAAPHSKDIEPHRCYQCSGSTCDQLAGAGAASWYSVVCPKNSPYCATFATGPSFESSLTCASDAAAAGGNPCSLSYSEKQTYVMKCICTTSLCNAPFSRELQNGLIKFTSFYAVKNDSKLANNFWKFANATMVRLYNKIAVDISEPVSPTSGSSQITTPTLENNTIATKMLLEGDLNVPQAEALKQETTMPSSDDEDEGEGSGAEEEAHSPRPSASGVPAAPSSYLPAAAGESSAQTLLVDLLAVTPLLFHIIR